MPLPSRQDELYEKVSSDLRERFVPGSILPGEPDYARQLGCGRTTLRKVLARLAEEGRIARTHSGTKVLNVEPVSQTASDRPIFLLVPCSESIPQVLPHCGSSFPEQCAGPSPMADSLSLCRFLKQTAIINWSALIFPFNSFHCCNREILSYFSDAGTGGSFRF